MSSPPRPLSLSWKFGRRFNAPAKMERFTLCFPDIEYLYGASKINHKNCRSWNLKTHSFWGKVWHHILKQINHFQGRHEVSPLKQFSFTKFNHLRWPNFHVTSINMIFTILAWNSKFQKTRDNSFLQTLPSLSQENRKPFRQHF